MKRAAGMPPIITLVEPMAIASGGPTQGHHVAHPGCRLTENENGRTAYSNRPADMRFDSIDHRAEMQIGDAGRASVGPAGGRAAIIASCTAGL